MTAAFFLALVANSLSFASGADEDRGESVFVQVGGPAVAAAETQRALVSALGPMAVTVKPEVVPAIDVANVRSALATPAGDTTWLAQVYVDSAGSVMAAAATVFVVDWRHGRLFMRSLPHSSPSTSPLIREQVVQIVVAAVGSLLAGQRVGEDREQAEQKLADLQRPPAPVAKPEPPVAPVAAPALPAPSPAPLPVTAPSWSQTLALGYGVRAAGSALNLQHGPSLAMAVHWHRKAWQLGPVLRASYLSGAERAGAPVAISLSQWPVWIGVDVGRRFASRALFHAAFLGGIEPTTVDPSPSDPQVTPAASTTLYIPSLAAALGVDATLTHRLRLRAEVGISVDGSQQRFVIQSLASPEETLRLGRVKPWGGLSVVGEL